VSELWSYSCIHHLSVCHVLWFVNVGVETKLHFTILEKQFLRSSFSNRQRSQQLSRNHPHWCRLQVCLYWCTCVYLVLMWHRWLFLHSRLQAGDGVIVGASNLSQLEQNLQFCFEATTTTGTSRSALLPENVVNAYNKAWEIVQGDCAPYFKLS
jgi:hypothetical protein